MHARAKVPIVVAMHHEVCRAWVCQCPYAKCLTGLRTARMVKNQDKALTDPVKSTRMTLLFGGPRTNDWKATAMKRRTTVRPATALIFVSMSTDDSDNVLTFKSGLKML